MFLVWPIDEVALCHVVEQAILNFAQSDGFWRNLPSAIKLPLCHPICYTHTF